MKSETVEKKSKKEPRSAKIKKKKLKHVYGDDFFGEFATEAKEFFKGDAMIPSGEDDMLIEVNGWIPMPEDVAHMIDAPGFPCGLITTIAGPPDSGKTTFANEALRSVQQEGGVAVLAKTEDKYSLKRAKGMGIDVKKMLILRPKTIEQVGDHVQTLINIIKQKGWEEKKVCLVWDSLAATPCAAEMNVNRKDFSMDAAKAVRGMLRRVSALIKESNIAFVIINQVYDNLNSFGEKTTQYGGKGAIYHSALILKIAQKNRIRPSGKKEGDFCGINAVVEVKKNHLGQPFKTGEFHIDWRGFVNDRSPEYAPSFLKDLKDIDDEEIEASDDDEPEYREPSAKVHPAKNVRPKKKISTSHSKRGA